MSGYNRTIPSCSQAGVGTVPQLPPIASSALYLCLGVPDLEIGQARDDLVDRKPRRNHGLRSHSNYIGIEPGQTAHALDLLGERMFYRVD